ncbi:hypothetical protein G6F40_017504 [Rhizopus arrhizus]|nr:hypothetical protein G6F40_017504 [Rhizopus arrhizus]
MLAPARAVRAERIEAAQPQVAARHQHALALVEQQVGIGGGDMLQHDRIDALVGQRQRQRAAGIAGIAVAVPAALGAIHNQGWDGNTDSCGSSNCRASTRNAAAGSLSNHGVWLA